MLNLLKQTQKNYFNFYKNKVLFQPTKYLFSSSEDPHYSICIIGAGPAGFMCAKQLMRQYPNILVHVYEKQPFPFGLIRYGVAPDHLPIKNVQEELSTIGKNENLRYYGNIEIGKDLQIQEIKDFYSTIIYAYGADSDRKLNIKGEEAKNVFGAKDVVNWYNKHPDYYNKFDINFKGIKNVAIIGNGNVAIDISRIFLKDTTELAKTEISEQTIAALQDSEIENVHIIGRRGVVQSAFTIKELRDLTKLPNVKVYIFRKDLELSEQDKTETTVTPQILAKPRANGRKLKLISQQNIIEDEAHYQEILKDKSHKKIFLRYKLNPEEIIANENNEISQLNLQKMKLSGNAYEQKASSIEGESEKMDIDLLVRSIGYQSQRISNDIGWNSSKQVIESSNGCVVDNEGSLVKGQYVAGWIKTGPIGVLDTTYVNAIETCNNILNHMSNNVIEEKEDPTNEIEDLLYEKEINYLTFSDWELVDKFEKEEGKKLGKIRSKVTERDQVFEIIKEAYPWTCHK